MSLKPKIKQCLECGRDCIVWSKGKCKTCAARTPKKKGEKPMAKEKGVSELAQVLQPLINKLVRLRYANKNGGVRCYTCATVDQWDSGNIHAGHCFTSTNWGTRFEIENLRPQCSFCNNNCGGRPEVFKGLLKMELGEQRFEELEKQAHAPANFSREELSEKIKWVKSEIKKELVRLL